MFPALFGGALIGAAASLYWFATLRVAGVSGILHGAIRGAGRDRTVRLAFLLGLVAAGVAVGHASDSRAPGGPASLLPLAGLLVGFGARLGGGCTSGHGVCGVSRLQPRSLVATVTFIATGALTVFLVNHFAPALGVPQ